MLNLDDIEAPIGSVAFRINGEPITLHYRQATHPEVVEIRFEMAKVNERLREAAAKLKDGEDPERWISPTEYEKLIAFVDRLIVDVEGIEQQWGAVKVETRLSVVRRMPEPDLWRLLAVSATGLQEPQKKSSGPTSTEPSQTDHADAPSVPE